jgi:hypothetical protein
MTSTIFWLHLGQLSLERHRFANFELFDRVESMPLEIDITEIGSGATAGKVGAMGVGGLEPGIMFEFVWATESGYMRGENLYFTLPHGS